MSEAGANMEALRFDRSYNAGQVATVLTLLLVLGGMIFQQGRFQATTETRLAAGEAVRAQYVPIINSVVTSSQVTNDRLNSIGAALNGIRTDVSGLRGEAAAIRERLVAIETKVEIAPVLQKQGFTPSTTPPEFPSELDNGKAKLQ